MFKNIFIGTAIIAIAGFLAVQAVNAGPGRGFGPGSGSPCIERGGSEGIGRSCFEGLSDEQLALRQEYRDKKWELRSELLKDTIDGDRIAVLHKELNDLRSVIGIQAPSEEQLAQMKEYRDRKWELRSELRKDAVDGDRIAELRKELTDLRSSMGAKEPSERRWHKGGEARFHHRR